jgi:acyl dehydratase
MTALERDGTAELSRLQREDLRSIATYGKWTFKMAAFDVDNGKTMNAPSPHPRGGLYFDDFVIGQVYSHRLTRTVTQMDNMLFSNMTLNPQPLHIDAHFCATETEWGKPLMNSLFTLGLMIGIAVNDTTVGTTIANLGMTEVRFPAPLFEGDTIHCTTEILTKRASKSRPDAGILEFHHRAFNQRDVLVAECKRQAFMKKRPLTPPIA